ncbi:ATP-binding protein [Aeromonas jandaei]|uniref:ATP-binding protein n=1 Tax=Aeromonas jandaei TaxID=650 RepID=UPI0039877E58
MTIEFNTKTEEIELYHNNSLIMKHSKRGKLHADGKSFIPMLQGTNIESIPSDLNLYISSLPKELSSYYSISIDNSEKGMRISLTLKGIDVAQWDKEYTFHCYVDKLNELIVNLISPIESFYDYDHESKTNYTFLCFSFFSSHGDLVENIIAFSGEITNAQENARVALSEKPSPLAKIAKTEYGFCEGASCSLEESLFTEFKEVKGQNPKRSIQSNVDEYVISFLNSEGGSIFWGIDDSGIVKSVTLDSKQKDEIRQVILSKLNQIEPSITLNKINICFHEVKNVENGFVIEVNCQKSNETGLHYSSSGETWIRADGIKQKIQGSKLEKYLKERLR